MTDRDRLIELKTQFVENFNCENCTPEESKCKKCLIEKETDYLLASGVIVPPVSVGQMVYSFCDTFGVILPYFVEKFDIGFLDKDRNYWYWEANSHALETDELLDEIDFDLDDIGKTVFLTKEEAEAKLKEREG